MRTLIRGSPAVFVLALAWATDNVEVVDVVAVCAAIQRQVNLKDAYPGKDREPCKYRVLCLLSLLSKDQNLDALLGVMLRNQKNSDVHFAFHKIGNIHGIVCDHSQLSALTSDKSRVLTFWLEVPASDVVSHALTHPQLIVCLVQAVEGVKASPTLHLRAPMPD